MLNLGASLNLNLNLNLPGSLRVLARDRVPRVPAEDQLLNGIWIGLLSVEALMVLAVALRGLLGALWASRTRARPKAAACAHHRSVRSGADSGLDPVSGAVTGVASVSASACCWEWAAPGE